MLQAVVDAVRSKLFRIEPFNVLIVRIVLISFCVGIRLMVRTQNYDPPNREVIRALEKKLDKCRNQENNPDSTM